MHRLIASSLFLLLLTPGCAGVQKVDTTSAATISLAEFEADPLAYGSPLEPDGKPVIIKIPAGEKIPLKIDMSIPFATVESGENTLRFDLDVYAYMGGGRFMISPDGERWAEMGDWKALKELFNFDKGLFSVGFGVSEAEGAFMSLAMKTEQK
ncbi:MAG: hypothetical protein JRG91_02685 [Deltaproteobacteria bacterium]|nr:hypothetical protein [Deltaproteobacteria bacterium]